LKRCPDFTVLFPELADKKTCGILAAVDAANKCNKKYWRTAYILPKSTMSSFHCVCPTS